MYRKHMASFTQGDPFIPDQCQTPWSVSKHLTLDISSLQNDCNSVHKTAIHSLLFSDAGKLTLVENTQ